jgi:putative methyltransferase (TIGR04325 family)
MSGNLTAALSKAVHKAVKRYTHTDLQPCNYRSYAEALLQCETGYSTENLIEVVYEKTKIFRDALYRQKPLIADYTMSRELLVLSMLAQKKLLRVVDFGGACGAHYFIANHFLKGRVEINWHVVETHNMVQKGKLLEDGQLRFFEDIPAAVADFPGVDLLFSSSTLQYVPDPAKIVDEIFHCGAEYVFLTRLPLLEAELGPIITIQTSHYSGNGPGPLPPGMPDGLVKYPITFLEKKWLEGKIREGYAELICFDEGPAHYYKGAPINSFGYLAKII